jgi:hypothetical protein
MSQESPEERGRRWMDERNRKDRERRAAKRLKREREAADRTRRQRGKQGKP